MSPPWKPIPPNPELDALLKRSKEIVDKMTPLEKAVMHLEQRRSWVVGNMGLDHPEITEERLQELATTAAPEWLILQEMRRLQGRVAELELEGAALSAGVCENRGGNEHGNPMCLATGHLIESMKEPVTELDRAWSVIRTMIAREDHGDEHHDDSCDICELIRRIDNSIAGRDTV